MSSFSAEQLFFISSHSAGWASTVPYPSTSAHRYLSSLELSYDSADMLRYTLTAKHFSNFDPSFRMQYDLWCLPDLVGKTAKAS